MGSSPSPGTNFLGTNLAPVQFQGPFIFGVIPCLTAKLTATGSKIGQNKAPGCYTGGLLFLRLLSFVAPGATCLVRVPRRVTLAVLLERNAVFLAVMNWWRLFRGDGQVEQRRAGSSLQAGHEAQRVPGL